MTKALKEKAAQTSGQQGRVTTTVPENINMSHALDYLKLGWHPIPLCWPKNGECACHKKHTDPKDIAKAPLLDSYSHLTKVTEANIREWWTKWPEANIGILQKPSKLVTLDPDSKEAIAEAESLGLPISPRDSTGRGQHIYYSRPEHARIARKIDKGESKDIDVLSAGYVIVAPSVHASGRSYEWLPGLSPDEVKLAEAPAWAVDILNEGPIVNAAAAQWSELIDVNVDELNIHNTFKELIKYGVDRGGRSTAVYAVILALVEAGYDVDTIASVLLDSNNGISEKPLEQGEAWTSADIGRVMAKHEVKKYEGFDAMNDSEEKTIDLSGIRTPVGFKVIGGKIFEVKELKNDVKYVPVCDCIVAVIARSESLTDGTQGLDVRWTSGNGTRTLSKPRSTFMDSKKIIDLADYGLPVHSGNARNLATYISRFESANEQNLKTRRVSNQLGWTKGGFLLGDTFIGDGDVRFEPKDGGDAQIAKGFHVNGTMEGTLDVLNKIKPFPMVKMAIYAALSAPLLKKWGESPYIFELAGTTSRGKTTALRIAASLYGCPDESKPGFFKQWNATKVSLERYASIMNHLPLFIDDTKNGDADRVIKPIIYQFASGQGKGRGSLQGMQISANWQTVMLSTGEQKITSFAKDGGAVARVLSLEGSPFTTANIESARLVQELNKQVSEHYGNVAEPWIRFLQTTDMKPWKKKFETVKDGYLQMARGDGEVAMRLSGITALIDVVGEMFDTCFGLNLHSTDELHNEWGTTVSGSTEMDRAQEALDDTLGWVDSHHQQFIKGDSSPYHGVLLGEIKKDKLIIIAVNLNDFLEAHGYSSGAIAKKWRDNGWLITWDDGKKRTQDNPKVGGRTQDNPKVGGKNKRSYVFDLSKIDWSFDFNARFSEFDPPE